MRLTLQIFATVFLSSLFLGGLLMVGIDASRAYNIERLSDALPAEMKSFLSSVDANAWRVSAVLWLVLSLGTIVGIVAVWLRKRIFGLVVGGALVLFTALAAYLQPHIDTDKGYLMESVGTNVAIFGGLGIVILVLLHTAVRE